MGAYDREKELLFQAAASPLGIVVASLELELDIKRLEKARQGEAQLAGLEFRRDPENPKERLWIVKVQRQGAPKALAEPPPKALDPAAINLEDLRL